MNIFKDLVLRCTRCYLVCKFVFVVFGFPLASRLVFILHIYYFTVITKEHRRSQGDPGVPVTPLCKPSCKQTTYNIQVTI